MTILTKKKQDECLQQLYRLQKLVQGLPVNDFFEATELLAGITGNVCGLRGLNTIATLFARDALIESEEEK